MFLKHHKVVTSEALMVVELVVKGQVKDKSYEPKYKNCLTGAFVAWLSTLQDCWRRILWARCPSRQPTNSVKALKARVI